MNRLKAGWSGDPPTHGEADDPSPRVPDIVDGYGTVGTTKVRGLQQVVAAVRGDIVDGVIQGDLAGSRAVLAHDARPGGSGWPVVHDGPVGGSVEVG